MTAAKGGLRIAKGADKTTIGRIHGDYFNADPEDVHELSKKLLNDPEWTQVGMNPFRHRFSIIKRQESLCLKQTRLFR